MPEDTTLYMTADSLVARVIGPKIRRRIVFPDFAHAFNWAISHKAHFVFIQPKRAKKMPFKHRLTGA